MNVAEYMSMTRLERGSEEKYRHLLENINDAAFLLDVKTAKIIDANVRAGDLLGVSREEVLGRHPIENHPPDKADEYRLRFIRHVEKGHAADYDDGEVMRKDGTIVPVAISASTFTIDGHHLILGICRDITERKKAEKALEESEEKFRNLFEQSRDAIYIVDRDGSFVDVNQSALDLFGYSREEMLQLSARKIYVSSSDRHQFQQVIEKEGYVRDYALKLRKKDRTEMDCLTTATLRRDKDNQILGYQGIIRDITEQKKSAIALQSIEEKCRIIFESIVEGVVVYDLDGSIVQLNDAAVKLYGFQSKDELIGRNALGLIAREDYNRAECDIKRIAETWIEDNVEYTCLRRDGTEFSAELTISLMRDKAGNPTGYVAVIRDITERKRFEEQIKFYISEIVRAHEEERKHLARELHDDTIQPLIALSLDIETITKGRDGLTVDNIQQLRLLQSNISRVTNDVRRFSHKLRPGILDKCGLVPALELLTDEVKERMVNAKFKAFGSTCRLSPETELVLFRIAQEALCNVWKHSGATESLTEIYFTPNKVRLSVTDDGSGFKVPKELYEFAGKAKLGLVGMQERAVLIGGRFSVKSQPGKGTVVTIEVPT